MNYQRMVEELTTQCVIKMQNDPNHSANHIYDAICTALQAAAETMREWNSDMEAVPSYKTIWVATEYNGYGTGLMEPAYCKALKDAWFNAYTDMPIEWKPTHWRPSPAPPNTPRTAKQSEAVIAKTLGKNLTVVKEDV